MSRKDKVLERILTGESDANISFEELCDCLKDLGFRERISGSHHIYTKEGVPARINLQRDGSKAKAYQVQQVRNILLKYNLTGR